METRIKEVAKLYGISLTELANRLKVSRQSLHNKANGNPSLETLELIAKEIGCKMIELIPADEGYGHFYVEGEWHGIRKL